MLRALADARCALVCVLSLRVLPDVCRRYYKDSSLVPRVQERDILKAHLGHTSSSNRGPMARANLW